MGPGVRTLEYLDCPECGISREVTVSRGERRIVYFYCPTCTPRRLDIGCDLPGLPSDLSFLRAHGRQLIVQAISRVREEAEARRAASEKADVLLMTHLTDEQRRSFAAARRFDVISRYTDKLFYRIALLELFSHVDVLATDMAQPPATFLQGVSQIPNLGWPIREAAASAFLGDGCVKLCLHLHGSWLPAADAGLAYKLSLEVDEARIWIKGLRQRAGLKPESIRFAEVAF